MREVSIKALRKSLSSELGNLPFVVTKRGVPIAKCTPYVECTPEDCVKCTPKIDEKSRVADKILDVIAKKPSTQFFNPQPKKGK